MTSDASETDPLPPIGLKPNWRAIAALSADTRTADRIAAHYVCERALAEELRTARRGDRLTLYSKLYDRLFATLSDHPQRTRSITDRPLIDRQIDLLKRVVPRGARYAEIGAGDAQVTLGLCDHCASCCAIDVSDAVLPSGPKPANFRSVLIDGLHLPFPDASFDFVYSNQLMEHLHPEDAAEQLAEIHRVLAPGGAYLCVTPNAVTGPHDVSKYVDRVPSGFHLKEYTYGELALLFATVGFARRRILLRKGSRQVELPDWVGLAIERLLAVAPSRVRPSPNLNRSVRNLMGVCLIGYKA